MMQGGVACFLGIAGGCCVLLLGAGGCLTSASGGGDHIASLFLAVIGSGLGRGRGVQVMIGRWEGGGFEVEVALL